MSTNDDENEFTVDHALEYMTPDNIERLRRLSSAPPNIVKAALPLIPFGSRIGMEVLGMLTRDDGEYELTPFGLEVIQAIKEHDLS